MGLETARSVEIFQYMDGPELLSPLWSGFGDTGPVAPPSARGPRGAAADEAPDAIDEEKLAEETRRSFEAGRERGMQEGRQTEREVVAAARQNEEKQRAGQVAELIRRFAEDREHYLHAVEHEVVSLALAISARILRREAQMDPLLLTGAVRVALGQLSNTTEVKLRVPSAELDLWREAIAHVPNLTVKPTVLAGEGMRLGDCLVETSVGSVDLGIRAQMAEIERGFFDRAGRGNSDFASGAHEAREARA